ncbi:MAG TPA: DUF924 family protein [Thiobacillaceae bacterium]|nr:DUF924 family protein [Thiobacillaceae bacterium]
MPNLDSQSADHDFEAIVNFWRDAGPRRWFTKNAAFDAEFRSRFLKHHEAAAQEKLNNWANTAFGALALVILLDQFPRNAFRGTARMYATDRLARQLAARAIAAGFDLQIPVELRLFFYLPYAHSEDLDDQDRSVELSGRLGIDYLKHALEHRAIILRFGRFPHRNEILGRMTTAEERRFLDAGGFAG